jgi:pimeloyl-ACP methyl ester carboxylesterase
MVTGSGAQNRDEEILGFKPFRIIADYLTRRGVAVYRYDDRGVGGSTGNTGLSTTSDFADDALAAISALSEHAELDASQIGLIGHSEGGVVAPLAAQRSESVAFVVLIAPTSVPGSEVIYEQGAEIARVAGQSEEDIAAGLAVQRRLFEAVANGDDLNAFRTELEQMIRDQISTASDDELAVIDDIDQFVASQVNQQIAQVTSPWFRFFLTYDPATALRQTRVPVLALFGELDLQVTPKQNRGPLAEALGGNPDVTIETFPGANHLFQSASTGSPTEYASLAKEFVPGFLDLIGDWIVERTDAEGR